MKKPTLFVSYSHSPPEHQEKVQALISKLLTREEFEIIHDNGIPEPQGPPEGWMTWMSQQIEKADWVLVVCNDAYLASRTKKQEAGRSVAYEATFLRQQLYDNRMVNNKIIPVTMTKEDRKFIPTELADSTSYMLPQELDPLLLKILESTWLGRFIIGLGGEKEENPSLSSSEIMRDAAQLDDLVEELPAIASLRQKLENEANGFIEKIPSLDGALSIQREKLTFRKSFCPKMKEFFELTKGNIPKTLEIIYENECL